MQQETQIFLEGIVLKIQSEICQFISPITQEKGANRSLSALVLVRRYFEVLLFDAILLKDQSGGCVYDLGDKYGGKRGKSKGNLSRRRFLYKKGHDICQQNASVTANI